jgi:hypothetical protein
MKLRRIQFGHLAALAIAGCAVVFTACGGGGGGGHSGSPPVPTLTITNASLPTAYEGKYYDVILQASGGVPPYTWVNLQDMPPGMSMGHGVDWHIEGTPSQIGTYAVPIEVRDSRGGSAHRDFTLTVKKAMHLMLGPLPDGQVNHPYSYTFQATDGTPPYTWSWAASALYSSPPPPGLSLSPDGVVSGRPTTGGYFTFEVTVRDAEGQTDSFTPSVRIWSLQVSTGSLQDAVLNQPYSFTLEATHGDPPFTWSLNPGGALPNGISLSSSGVLSGTPTETGAFSFEVTVQDSSGQTATAGFVFYSRAPVRITTTSLPDGNIGRPYEAHFSATGGWGWYNWSIEPGGALPDGIVLDSESSDLRGTPTVAGTFDFTLRAQSSYLYDTRAFRLFIDNKLTLVTTDLPDAVVTSHYSYTVRAVGGTPPYTWSRVGGSAGPEFTINPSTGEITAIPAEAGSFSLTVKVTDSSATAQEATHDYPLRVLPPPSFTTTALPQGALQSRYDTIVFFDGGLGPYSVRITHGSLPSGLTFSNPGWSHSFEISGTPAAVGTYPVTFELADSSSPPLIATQPYTIQVNEALKITTDSLPDGNVGDFYSATLTATGGVPPYTWGVYTLPRDLWLNPNDGTISGVPQYTWSGPASVRVTDSGSVRWTVSKSIPFNITAHPKIRTSRLPRAKLNAPYRVGLLGTGGQSTLRWSITSGTLPTGLLLDSSLGEISGTPTQEQTQTFTVRLQNSSEPPEYDERSLTIEVTAAPGRNDSIATATPISNGTFHASLSPYADPPSGPGNPDNDYYQLTANPGAVVTVETFADRLSPPSPADTVIEILGAGGERFNTCRTVGVPYPFNEYCLNDDNLLTWTLDSRLEFQVPGTSGTPVTFYVHVLDWSGSARPDFLYDLQISGAN